MYKQTGVKPGSPPHTRGKVPGPLQSGKEMGITPAHAGKSTSWVYPNAIIKDHPRTRGEKPSARCLPLNTVGSPPHTRGKALVLPPCPGVPGITPAHAGKRSRSLIHSPGREDHPRTRGEKFLIFTKRGRKMGSPPHTRGKDKVAGNHGVGSGITPAHAGKSNSESFIKSPRRDHPRTRGEKPASARSRTPRRGSPPHTRGKVIAHPDVAVFRGITPAHAGKSRLIPLCSVQTRDHPRTRGEKVRPSTFTMMDGGSPPHTRGKGLYSGD